MSDQESLFGPELDDRKDWQRAAYEFYNGIPPHQRHSMTSLQAATSVLPTIGTYRRRVYDCIQEHDEMGVTDEEGIAETGMAANTWRPRRRELQMAGFLSTNGTRQTRSGRWAVVWIVDRENE